MSDKTFTDNAKATSKNTPPGQKGKKNNKKKEKQPMGFEKRGLVRLGSENPKSSFYVKNVNEAPVIGHWGVVTKGEYPLEKIAKEKYGYESNQYFIFDANEKKAYSFYEESMVFWPVIQRAICKPNASLKIPSYRRLSKYPKIENATKFSYIRADIYDLKVLPKSGDILIHPSKAFYEEYIYNGSHKQHPGYEPAPSVYIDYNFSVPGRTTMQYLKYLHGYKDSLTAGYECGPLLYDPPSIFDKKFYTQLPNAGLKPQKEGFKDPHDARIVPAPKDSSARLPINEISLAKSITDEIETGGHIKQKKHEFMMKKGAPGGGTVWKSPQNMVKYTAQSGAKANVVTMFVFTGASAFEEYKITQSFQRASYVFATELVKASASTVAGLAASWAVAACFPGTGWAWIAGTSIVVSFLSGKAFDELQKELENDESENNTMYILGIEIDFDECKRDMEDAKIYLKRFLTDQSYQRDLLFKIR